MALSQERGLELQRSFLPRPPFNLADSPPTAVVFLLPPHLCNLEEGWEQEGVSKRDGSVWWPRRRGVPSNAEAPCRPLCFNLYLRVCWRGSIQIIPATFGGYGSCDMVYHLMHMTRSILTRRCWALSTLKPQHSSPLHNPSYSNAVSNGAQSGKRIGERSVSRKIDKRGRNRKCENSLPTGLGVCVIDALFCATALLRQTSNSCPIFPFYIQNGLGYSLGGCVSSACFIEFTRS